MKACADAWVEVRSKEEILSTLDKDGRLDELPFTPQMFQYCGQRFRVYKSAYKTCDTVGGDYAGRGLPDGVHLDVRCDGQAYGRCRTGCLIHWKSAWLKPVEGPAPARYTHDGDQSQIDGSHWQDHRMERDVRTETKYEDAGGEARCSCQATELLNCTEPLKRRDTTYPTDGSLESIRLLGTPVACATYDSALERIKALAREPRATAVCPSNTHILGEARHNPEFARVLARFDLVLPDGMPVVWALNFRGAGLRDRVYGPYFMRHAVRNTPRPWRHFFFGDSEECLVELRRVLVQLQPDIEIVGMLSPPFRPFTEADEVSFADTINRADPDFVWVALPGVRMERWIIDNQARYQGGVFLAVGDAFTLLSGRRSFAPPWMQRMGLTWVYRLCKEPLRLGPRYLRYNFMFVSYWLWDVLRRRAWEKVRPTV